MVTNVDILRVEEHLHSVRDIKKLTLSAEDAVEWAIINKIKPAPHADILLPDSVDVINLIILDKWSQKVQQRKGTGTGRMRYLKTIPRVFKNQIKGLAKWSAYYLNLQYILKIYH